MSGKFGKVGRVLGVALAAGSLLLGGVNAAAAPQADDAAPANENIIEITDQATYDEVLKLSHEKPVLLDFGKENCIPCEELAPVLKEKVEADAGKWTLAKIDGTKLPKIWESYGKPWFPTLISLKDGKETYRHTGYDGNAEAIKGWVDSALGINGAPPPEPPQTEMDVTADNIEEVKNISKSKVVVLKFGAEWCGPCQQLAPVISGFAKDDGGKWMLGKIDGDVSPDLVEQYKVEGYPTMVVLYNGADQTPVVERYVGYSEGDEAKVREWVDTALNTKYPSAVEPQAVPA